MLSIREISDFHLEHYYDLYDSGFSRAKEELLKLIPSLPTDKKSVLIIAGDLATARRPNRIVTFLELVVPRFHHVIYVLGNHEHYGCCIDKTEQIIMDALKDSKVNLKKLTVAGNVPVKIKIKDVTFLCGTLWTDYGRGNAKTAEMVLRFIRDHSAITDSTGKTIATKELGRIHEASLLQFGEWLREQDNAKTVMVTHHMPSYTAVDPQFTLDPTTIALNGAFASDLDEFILKHQPAMWFFGHTHTPYHGKIGNTQLICNPLGYPGEYNELNGIFVKDAVYSL